MTAPRSTCQEEDSLGSAVAAATCPKRRCRFCGAGCTSTASTPTRRSRRNSACRARPASRCCRYVTGSSMHVAACFLTCFARTAKIPPSSPSPVRSAVEMKGTRRTEVEAALRKATLPLARLSSAHPSFAQPLPWTSVFLGTLRRLF